MIGDLLLVHVRDVVGHQPHLLIPDEGTISPEALAASDVDSVTHTAAMIQRPLVCESPLRWVLNVYVPLYFELRQVEASTLSQVINPRRDELQNIFQGLVDKIGNIFHGWTELGWVTTTWRSTAWSAGKGMELRWVYQHMLIATEEPSWRDMLQIAEADCEESLLAAVMYSVDFSALAAPLAEADLSLG